MGGVGLPVSGHTEEGIAFLDNDVYTPEVLHAPLLQHIYLARS